MTASERRVVIIGGGLAGLAAAVALAERQIPAVVLESRPRLGGRASSFLDSTTQSYVDNCQHVTMGCCTNFAHFIRTIGLEHGFRRERTLHFIGPSGHPDRFEATNWPCPFHLAAAFRRLSYLTWRDKWAIARGLRELAKPKQALREDMPFSEWLRESRQPAGAVNGFWQVVLVSALSESRERISVPAARKVFVDGFLRHRDGWVVDIPTVPLEELYGSRLIGWLSARGVEVRLQAGVEHLESVGGRIESLLLRDGSRMQGDEFVLAVPWQRVADMMPEILRSHPAVTDLAKLESAPISSLHLWLDRPITDLPHAVLVGRLSQWLFNRTAIAAGSADAASKSNEYYYQIVISASRELATLSAEEVERHVLAELADIWPQARAANVLHRRLVTEHRAVFSVQPGAERYRPEQQSPVENLQWAGDWTRTGWPATMEGAVRSGYLAAENVLRRLGRAEKLVRPDLPTSFWSRWLLRIS